MTAIVIGAGPAGLMAAQVLAQSGVQVDVYDRMPSVGRKFLLAGRGGLNLTHAESLDRFIARYTHDQARETLAPWITEFGADQVRAWAQGLGIETFVGTSSRVFPTDLKAAPLLRAWLHQLRGLGVRFHMRHHWLGWDTDGALLMQTPTGTINLPASLKEQGRRALVLALGGASWPRLGSDGAWLPVLQSAGVDVAPLLPANCGFDVAAVNSKAEGPAIGWSPFLRERFAGQPIKPVVVSMTDAQGQVHRQQGEFVLTDTGVEGSLIYSFASRIRDAIAQTGPVQLLLDLLPDYTPDRVLAEVSRPRGPRSLSTHLKSRFGLTGLKAALLHEVLPADTLQQPAKLAAAIKALPITLVQARPVAEAISTAGGVRFDGLTEGLMLAQRPGVFFAGEMLDWEAPTGGYLLTACLSTGHHAGQHAVTWINKSAT
jgi:uncharacterized flavoprotein (TIGR03862 family)